jgi:hypothetical protein
MGTDSDWVGMYRKGVSGGSIARLCDDDPLKILKALAAARRQDPTLEPEHTANLGRNAREVEEAMAVERAFTPSWRRRIAELEAYVRDHGRMPRQVGGDSPETALGRWLHAQRGKVAKGALDPRQRAALDAIGAWDSATRPQREASQFPDQLRALAAFRAKHRRWPTYRNRDDNLECMLGTWLHTLRQSSREGRLPDGARQALDRYTPGWNA